MKDEISVGKIISAAEVLPAEERRLISVLGSSCNELALITSSMIIPAVA